MKWALISIRNTQIHDLLSALVTADNYAEKYANLCYNRRIEIYTSLSLEQQSTLLSNNKKPLSYKGLRCKL